MRFARPGADSTVWLSMLWRLRVSARNRVPATSLPGGFVVSIARYCRSSSTVSSPSPLQSIAPIVITLPWALAGASAVVRAF